jgi:acetolactate synthase-1/3 small subunit
MKHTGQHTVTALVQNEHGTLNRMISLFRRRGFSLNSLAVGDCEEPGLSRMSIVVEADDNMLRQCVMQMEKAVDVIHVESLHDKEFVRRELAFIQVGAPPERRSEIIDISRVLNCEIVHLGLSTMTVQVVANAKKIEGLIRLLAPYGIIKIVRSGTVAMSVEECLPTIAAKTNVPTT